MPHLLLYFLALVCLSTAPNLAKLNQMPAEVLGFWRLTLAAFILMIYQVFYKKQKLWPTHHSSSKWIITSGFFFFLHLWTYKFAAKHTLVSLTMILFATNPIWTALFNIYAFKEKITARMLASFCMAFIGIFLLAKDQIKFSTENNLGNLSAFLSAGFYALYLITGKKARATISNLNFASLQYSVCAFLFFIATVLSAIFSKTNFIINLTQGYSQTSWLSILALVAFPTLLGHFLFTHVMSQMNLAIMTCGKLIEPVLASFMAYFLFQEKLGPITYVAFSCTSLAILNLFWPQIKNNLLSIALKFNFRRSDF